MMLRKDGGATAPSDQLSSTSTEMLTLEPKVINFDYASIHL